MTYIGKGFPPDEHAARRREGHLRRRHLAAGNGTCRRPAQPYAHARIRTIDIVERRGLPGVVCVSPAGGRENMNPILEAYDTPAMGAKGVKWYALCPDRARYVGEAVAAVVAEDKFTAYAALDLIDVDYEELPVVWDPEEAMQRGARSSSRSGATTSWSAATSCSATRIRRSPRPTARSAGREVSTDHGRRDRAARPRRDVRRIADLHVLELHPEPSPAPELPRRDPPHAGDQDPRDPAPRRRRLRPQDPDLPGRAARRVRRAQARDPSSGSRSGRRTC